jgi:RNA polymerase sigma-70 factor, ECF subfamily
MTERLADDDLARRAGRGDREAMEVLLRRHQQRVFRICRRLCPSEPDAFDATQQALVTVARRIDRYDGRAAFTTWLYRVTTNACLDELRRRRRQVPLAETDPADLDEGDDQAGGGGHSRARDPAELVSSRLELDGALAALAPEFRAAVVLRDVADLDYAEIADVLDVPVGTVRSRIARGRAQLAELLGKPRDTRRPPAAGNSRGGTRRPRSEVEVTSPAPAGPAPDSPPTESPPPDSPPQATPPSSTPPNRSIGLPEPRP